MDALPVSRRIALLISAGMCLLALGLGLGLNAVAQPAGKLPSVHLEELTWTEVRDAIQAGTTTALIYTGSTEQNGPHLVLGKHNFIARHVAGRIATELGNAIVYPVLPYAPTGDSAARSGHMRFPGSIHLSTTTFRAVVRDLALSALAAGFRQVFLLGDHGDGQNELSAVARELDGLWVTRGQRVFYVPAVYVLQEQQVRAYLSAVGITGDGHGGAADTAELAFIDRQGQWVRTDAWARSSNQTEQVSGVSGDPLRADAAMGRTFIDYKITNGVRQIRELMNDVRR
jgi:creatinine amidohydrolase/Fe(II)-dependent formamide hydrolase-like protein